MVTKVIKKKAAALKTGTADVVKQTPNGNAAKMIAAAVAEVKALGLEVLDSSKEIASRTVRMGLIFRGLIDSGVVTQDKDGNEMKVRESLTLAFKPGSKPDSLKTLRSELGTFGNEKVRANLEPADYDRLIESGGDFWKKCVVLNRAIAGEKKDAVPAINAAYVKKALAPKKAEEKDDSNKGKAERAIKALKSALKSFETRAIINAAKKALTDEQAEALDIVLELLDKK